MMDEKTKLFIFNAKEIGLLFFFGLFMALTSFSLGVKIGRSYSYHTAGITDLEKRKIELESTQEEQVNNLSELSKINKTTKSSNINGSELSNSTDQPSEETTKKLESKKLYDHTYEKLKEEFNKVDQDLKSKVEASKHNNENEESEEIQRRDQVIMTKEKEDGTNTNAMESSRSPLNEKRLNNQEAQMDSLSKSSEASILGTNSTTEAANANTDSNMANKIFTIQLGSYPSKIDAMKFADGFRIRGYDAIIHEVALKDKGIWYRVSLGEFSSIAEAKNYIIQEESLFQGQDYVISELNN